MQFFDAIKAVQDSDEFAVPQDAYLAHVFRMYDDANEQEWQVGWYSPSDDELTVFTVSPQGIRKNPPAEAFKRDESAIARLDPGKLAVGPREALKTVRGMLADKHSGHPEKQTILLAQTLGIEDGERVIVFTESRDTAETLVEFLGEHFETRKFVGQGDREGSDGMTQTEQQETLDAFRAGEFEVLVSTSVAEEGLDVPEVDLVLFYEPVPKGIRAIQRKGRTGRQREGKVHVLLAEDTRDEAYFWIARRQEKQMEEELRELKGVAGEVNEELGQHDLAGFDASTGDADDGDGTAARTNGDDGASEESTSAAPDRNEADPDGSAASTDADRTENGTRAASENGGDGGQSGLDAFTSPAEREAEEDDSAASAGGEDDAATEEAAADSDDADEGAVATAEPRDGEVEIVVDQRELDANIARDLSTRDGIATRLETLAVGDYVLSDRVVVERKSVDDFLDTLTGGDRSLFEQVKDATRNYSRPVVVVEGEGLYEKRNVHPNAIRGALASLAVDFGASVLHTRDEQGTADLIETIARREQEESDRSVQVHGEKSAKTLDEQQEYVVSSIAEVGPVTARALLHHFGSAKAVSRASLADLESVDGISKSVAKRIYEHLRSVG